MTSTTDRLCHEIDDADLLAGRAAGVYRAVCGEQVVPAALTAPPGRLCPACATATAGAPAVVVDQAPHSRSTRRAVAAWLRHCTTSLTAPAPAHQLALP